MRDQCEAGATWRRPSDLEVSGYGSLPPLLGGGKVDLSMSETLLGVAVGWKP